MHSLTRVRPAARPHSKNHNRRARAVHRCFGRAARRSPAGRLPQAARHDAEGGDELPARLQHGGLGPQGPPGRVGASASSAHALANFEFGHTRGESSTKSLLVKGGFCTALTCSCPDPPGRKPDIVTKQNTVLVQFKSRVCSPASRNLWTRRTLAHGSGVSVHFLFGPMLPQKRDFCKLGEDY